MIAQKINLPEEQQPNTDIDAGISTPEINAALTPTNNQARRSNTSSNEDLNDR